MPDVLYSPIFEKGGNRFVTLYDTWTAADAETAHEIGWGVAFVEGMMNGFKFTCDTQRLEHGMALAHVKARLGPYDVMIIDGPLVTETTERKSK